MCDGAGLLGTKLMAQDIRGLYVIGTTLHDETIELARVAFDTETHTLCLPVRMQFHEGEEVFIGALEEDSIYEKDWIGGQLVLREIVEWTIKDALDSKLSLDSITDIEFQCDILCIRCSFAEIEIRVRSIDVSLIYSSVLGKARIRRSSKGSEGISTRIYLPTDPVESWSYS